MPNLTTMYNLIDNYISSWKSVLTIGILLRIVLFVTCRIWDYYRFLGIYFTDIDYSIFMAGAKALIETGTPYTAIGYRYSPLLAELLSQSIISGKAIFLIADVVCALMIYASQKSVYTKSEASKRMAIFFFNPIFAIISVRGNSDSISAALLAASVALQYSISGSVLLGIAIHFRLYPIIFFPLYVLNQRSVFSGIIAGITIVLTALLISFYYEYKYPGYFSEAVFYHTNRYDPQHNMSILYGIQLLTPIRFWPAIQTIVSTGVGLIAFYSEQKVNLRLSQGIYASSLVFVALCPVLTAQYFTWYQQWFSYLPYQTSSEILKRALLWLSALCFWLFWAYCYELLGFNIAKAGIILGTLLIGLAHAYILVVPLKFGFCFGKLCTRLKSYAISIE